MLEVHRELQPVEVYQKQAAAKGHRPALTGLGPKLTMSKKE
jgi:hypothetical protein